MRKLLIASNVLQRLDRLENGLAALGDQVRIAKSNAEVWPLVLSDMPDAVVVDASVAHARLDPWLLCGELQAAFKVPLIALIRPGRNHDRLRAFRAGASQCLAVPVSPAELSAALDTVLERHSLPVAGDRASTLQGYSDEWLRIDLVNRQVRRGADTQTLTGKEYKLLARLIKGWGNVVPAEALCEAVWEGAAQESRDGHLKLLISRLRSKIEIDPRQPQYIISRHGFGYTFVPQPSALTARGRVTTPS